MKILIAVVLFMSCFLAGPTAFCQDTAINRIPLEDSVMQDTVIARNPHFVVKPFTIPLYEMQDTVVALERNYRIPASIYIARDSLDRILDSIKAENLLHSKMQDTTILRDEGFILFARYAMKDSLDALGPRLSKRDSAIKAFRDSLNAIGAALLRTAEMQDTTVLLESAFVVTNIYLTRDSIQAIRDTARAVQSRAARMQDTTIILDPAFIVADVYAVRDQQDSYKDSVYKRLASAAQMQDTTILLEASFAVINMYVARDRLAAIQDSIARPTIMQDTTIAIDSSFLVKDLYAYKDSVEAIRDSLTALADSIYTDSVNRHWAGWKKYEVDPASSFALNSQKQLKGKAKANLQYNIADFYLYLNDDRVRPTGTDNDFFSASCLGFIYDDTLLLNSGLGFKVGVGVGIKIIQGRFTGTLHANANNKPVFKLYKEDTGYKKSVTLEPVTQSLKLQSIPIVGSNGIIVGEYNATYKRFYQKNDIEDDEIRKYRVRIIFRCRVSGGINSIVAPPDARGK